MPHGPCFSCAEQDDLDALIITQAVLSQLLPLCHRDYGSSDESLSVASERSLKLEALRLEVAKS